MIELAQRVDIAERPGTRPRLHRAEVRFESAHDGLQALDLARPRRRADVLQHVDRIFHFQLVLLDFDVLLACELEHGLLHLVVQSSARGIQRFLQQPLGREHRPQLVELVVLGSITRLQAEKRAYSGGGNTSCRFMRSGIFCMRRHWM